MLRAASTTTLRWRAGHSILSRTPNGLKVPSLRCLSRIDLCTMECLQVLYRARTAEVERVLADAHVARVVTLPLGDMREFVFDHRALAQRVASGGGLNLFAESLLELFVFRNGHRASVADFGGGALRAQGHRSQMSGSNSTTVPNEKPWIWPFGHSIVRLRRLRVKADLGNRLPLRDFHGLQMILPRLASTSSTSVLLMYPRSISRWSTSTPWWAMSPVKEGIASSSGRFAGVMAQARISPRSTSAAMCRLNPLNRWL